ncbi:MAG TPA: ankyrin repeat domain-containing protein [Tepidisphaeraceae bacterium]|nr:ankyrin repeat domain-containing protein [Tepidisphaeraceae bacterium]
MIDTGKKKRQLPEKPDLRPLLDEVKHRTKKGEFKTRQAAQHAIAREHGFASWPRLKQFIMVFAADMPSRATALVKAACSGDMVLANALVEADPKLAAYDLYTSCVTGELEAFKKHLEIEPEMARQKAGPLEWQPILYCCFSRFLRMEQKRADDIVEIVKLLLAVHADPNSHYFVETDNQKQIQTPLFAAAGIANNPLLTKMLLDAGADVNELMGDPGESEAPQMLGTEALYHASEFADTACLRLILEAKPHARRVSYCLGRALDFKSPDAAMLFLEQGADPNFRIPWQHNRTHLHKAVMQGRDLKLIEKMIQCGADVNTADGRGFTSYRFAVRFGHEAIRKLLEKHGAKVADATAEDLALFGCVCGGDTGAWMASADEAADVLCAAAGRNDVNAIERLLDAGVSASISGGEDETPALHWAAWRGQLEAARLLVEKGASLTQKNVYGVEALTTAIHGSCNCQDPEGGTGTRLAEEILHGQYAALVEMLISAGAALPPKIWGGSDAVQDVLRAHGVPDEIESDE